MAGLSQDDPERDKVEGKKEQVVPPAGSYTYRTGVMNFHTLSVITGYVLSAIYL
jgi:hypothetical protein